MKRYGERWQKRNGIMKLSTSFTWERAHTQFCLFLFLLVLSFWLLYMFAVLKQTHLNTHICVEYLCLCFQCRIKCFICSSTFASFVLNWSVCSVTIKCKVQKTYSRIQFLYFMIAVTLNPFAHWMWFSNTQTHTPESSDNNWVIYFELLICLDMAWVFPCWIWCSQPFCSSTQHHKIQILVLYYFIFVNGSGIIMRKKFIIDRLQIGDIVICCRCQTLDTMQL